MVEQYKVSGIKKNIKKIGKYQIIVLTQNKLFFFESLTILNLSRTWQKKRAKQENNGTFLSKPVNFQGLAELHKQDRQAFFFLN